MHHDTLCLASCQWLPSFLFDRIRTWQGAPRQSLCTEGPSLAGMIHRDRLGQPEHFADLESHHDDVSAGGSLRAQLQVSVSAASCLRVSGEASKSLLRVGAKASHWQSWWRWSRFVGTVSARSGSAGTTGRPQRLHHGWKEEIPLRLLSFKFFKLLCFLTLEAVLAQTLFMENR
jgi:hypothetical protein